MRHQVRREALAGVLALAAAALEVDLSDAVVILRNDATGALSAFHKGSFSSTFLQQCAMRSCLLGCCPTAGCAARRCSYTRLARLAVS